MKLILNKEVVANLNSNNMKEFKGGNTTLCITVKATACNPLTCLSCNPCLETDQLSCNVICI